MHVLTTAVTNRCCFESPYAPQSSLLDANTFSRLKASHNIVLRKSKAAPIGSGRRAFRRRDMQCERVIDSKRAAQGEEDERVSWPLSTNCTWVELSTEGYV